MLSSFSRASAEEAVCANAFPPAVHERSAASRHTLSQENDPLAQSSCLMFASYDLVVSRPVFSRQARESIFRKSGHRFSVRKCDHLTRLECFPGHLNQKVL